MKVSGVWCGALLYADDIVLIAESGEELQKMLDMVGRYAEIWKFRFNARKSKVMVVGKKNSGEKWKIGDEEMEEVESFKYLGVWFDQRMREMCSWRRWWNRLRNGQAKLNGWQGWMGN